MHAYNVFQCKKCKCTNEHDVRWYEENFNPKPHLARAVPQEHLEYTCTVCGYSFIKYIEEKS